MNSRQRRKERVKRLGPEGGLPADARAIKWHHELLEGGVEVYARQFSPRYTAELRVLGPTPFDWGTRSNGGFNIGIIAVSDGVSPGFVSLKGMTLEHAKCTAISRFNLWRLQQTRKEAAGKALPGEPSVGHVGA
jgi:hypothetical protein